MRISLIEAKPTSYNGFEKFVIPRLGLPIMAAMLKKLGHDVKVYVHQLEGIWQHSLEISKSDLIGISTTTPSAPEAYDLAKWVRRANRVRKKQIPVVLGGPHVSYLPDEGLEHADFVVRGEGEHTMLELVRALEDDGDFSRIRGLSYVEDDQIRHNPDRPLEPNLDNFAFADLTLMAGHQKLKHLPIATSRGCPHDCNYCCVVSMFGRAYRRRSNQKIVSELEEHLLPLGRRIFFVDDNFAGRPIAAKELLGMMKKRGLGKKMRWYTQVTVHAAKDEQLLDLMKDTNCTQVYVGLESINPATLKEFNKKQSVDHIRHCVKMFHKKGIRVHGMFMLGSDEDDADTIAATVEFAKKHDINTVQFALLTPLPGTRTFDRLESENRLFTREWGLYDAFHVVHEPAKMSMYELQKAAMEAWKHFYSVPSYMNAFMKFKLATGFLRFYGRKIVKKGRAELEEYLRKLMTLELQPQS
ncbi:B12-binding domain-containing radical SAM protein [Myxococcota bacterium]